MALLSVIVPVYNEAHTIKEILEKMHAVNLDKEIIVVEDGSTDGTDRMLKDLRSPNMKIIYHSSNRGKGAAFLTGLANATGDYVIIQDGDLEYDPREYVKLMQEMQAGGVDLVLGVRFTKGYHGLLIPRLGNRMLTGLINFLFRSDLNDFLTCYKLFRRDTLNALNLKSQGFDIDTELIIKSLKAKLRIKQVPITYVPRNYAQGKKIRIHDGVNAIFNILRFRFLKS